MDRDFMYALYELLYKAEIDPDAKRNALEEACWEKDSWRVVAISDAAIKEIKDKRNQAKVQRGHKLDRAERGKEIFSRDRPMLGKDELIAYFYEHDQTTLVIAQENPSRGPQSWSPTRAVPPGLFPNATKRRVRIGKLELEWIDKQRIPTLFYRRFRSGDGEVLVFATPARAALVDRFQRAVDESTTWGEFRHAVEPEEAERIDTQAFDEDDEPRPADADPFDFQHVPGYEDGDWPPWLATEMDLVLPESVLERFAQRCQSVHNGAFWRIPAHLEQPVLRALELEGVVAERRDDLCFH